MPLGVELELFKKVLYTGENQTVGTSEVGMAMGPLPPLWGLLCTSPWLRLAGLGCVSD